MYQVLVVDDDQNIRQGLYEILKDKLPPSSVCMMCDNGMVASRIIANNEVDVVITDIKMPVMGGVELLRFIKEGGYPTRSVVLSGYDDYNLVRDAMRMGAGDYLLKPVDIGLLVSTVNGMLRMTPSSDAATRPINGAHDQILLEHYLLGNTISSLLVADFACGDSNDCYCSLLCVDIVNSMYSERVANVLWLEDRVESFVKSQGDSAPAMIRGVLGDYWLLLVADPQAARCNAEALQPLIEVLGTAMLRTVFANEVPLEDARKLYSTCLERQQYYFFDLPYSQLPPDDVEPDQLLAAAMEGMQTYSYSTVIESLNQWFAMTYARGMTKREVQQKLLNLFYQLLSDSPEYIPIISRSKFTAHDAFYQIENSRSLSKLQKDLFDTVNYYVETCLDSRSDKEYHTIQKAKKYINDNFADSVTLSDVARHVFLHSNYFSTLFRSSTGITFREHLRQVRIRHAKELMDTTNEKIYEIAVKVGYNDSTHFVRAFKAVEGMSPNEYRKRG